MLTLDLPDLRTVAAAHLSREALGAHPAYATLLGRSATTGCCPVWVSERALDMIEPSGDPPAVVAAVGRSDAAAFLRDRWPRDRPHCGCRESFDQFTGLAPATEPGADPLAVAAASALGGRRSHLAIVAARRPADAVALLGWRGARNQHDDVTGLAAVLRSWEERFGAVLVEIGVTTLRLSVAAPPRTERECLAVAAEHVAFCPDVDGEDPRPLPGYASTLAGATSWRFRWD